MKPLKNKSWFEKERDKFVDTKEYWKEMADSYRSECEAIEKLIPKWISIKERLPEDYKLVLISVKANEKRFTYIAYYDVQDKIFRYDKDSFIGVTHWTNLLKPPEEK